MPKTIALILLCVAVSALLWGEQFVDPSKRDLVRSIIVGFALLAFAANLFLQRRRRSFGLARRQSAGLSPASIGIIALAVALIVLLALNQQFHLFANWFDITGLIGLLVLACVSLCMRRKKSSLS